MKDPSRNLLDSLEKVNMALDPNKTPPSVASTAVKILSTVKVVKSPAAVLSIVIDMIKEKLLLQDTDTTDLEKQLKFYFNEVGITTESSLAVMKDKGLWPLPSDLADTTNATNLIKTPILLTLCEIAEYVGRVHASDRFLGLGVTYKSLSKWAKAIENPGRYDAQSSSHSTTRGKPVGKVPHFTVPPFEGDALKGDVYISTVLNAFASAGQGQYLTDVNHCYINQEWSGAFASRLRESVNKGTFRYLSTQMDTEINCAKVWAHIKKHLSAKDLVLGRILTLWQSFFALRCDDQDAFLLFYSDAKHIIHKLRAEKSVALQDDTFLRAFFAGIINVPELKEVTKKFLTVHSKKTEDILDLVHADFRAMNAKEHMVDGVSAKGSTKIRRVQKTDDKAPVKPKGNGPPSVQYRKFPKNTGGLIPGDVYKQVKDWYGASAKTDDDKTEEDKAFLKTFKFATAKPAFHKRGNPQDSKFNYNEHRNARRAERYSEDREREWDRERDRREQMHNDYSPDDRRRSNDGDYSRNSQSDGSRAGRGNGGEQRRAARRTMFQR